MSLIPQPDPPPSGAVLAKIHAINSQHGYLPKKNFRLAADELGVPVSKLYSVAIFYSAFSFKPRGRHTIQVCMGTACYIRGDRLLGLKPGKETY